jgi:hypothetical protein
LKETWFQSSSRQGTRKVITFSFLSKLRWEWFCWFWFRFYYTALYKFNLILIQ